MKWVGKSDSNVLNMGGGCGGAMREIRVDGWSALCKTFSSFDKCVYSFYYFNVLLSSPGFITK